jgi:hypothetical protein
VMAPSLAPSFMSSLRSVEQPASDADVRSTQSH